VRRGWVDSAAVAHRGQPGAEAFRGEPVGAVLAVEAGQEPQADGAVEIGEEPDRAGEGALEVFTQLVGHGDAVADEVFAGPAGRARILSKESPCPRSLVHPIVRMRAPFRRSAHARRCTESSPWPSAG